MASFNKIVVCGYLGRDVEARYMPDGTAVASFSVATTEKRKNEEHTIWFKIAVFGRSAEACGNYLSKGSQVFVSGRLRQESYMDRDGNQRTSLAIAADDVQFLGSPGGSNSRSEQTTSQAPAATSSARPGAMAIEEDEIPF